MSSGHSPVDDQLSPTQLIEINRVCDGFEAAWRAGRRPAAEDQLTGLAGPERSALLCDLLATELECRRSLGEQPDSAEYQARFPDDVTVVETAFVRAGLLIAVAGSTPSDASNVSSIQGRRFQVLRPHAKGGLGAVSVALDVELNREVALKEILDHHADNPVSRQRFLVEAEITGGLEHPGIVPVYGLGTYTDGRPYYAMRFIKGDSLKDAIAAFHAEPASTSNAGKRLLALNKLLRRFLDVCNAIDYAHSRGVLHRDIKPGNVIVGKYGETLVVDWGLAKLTGHREASSATGERTLVPKSSGGGAGTLAGATLGTPAYMSPEQAAGNHDHLGPQCDVYGLGATLYSVLTGRPPVSIINGDVDAAIRAVREGKITPPRAIDPTIDRALEAICMKALAWRPANRYATTHALAEDVERWLANEPVLAYAEPWARTLTRWLTRHRTSVAAAVAALLAGLVGLGAVAAVQTKVRTELTAKNRELIGAVTRLDQQRRRAEEHEQQAVNAARHFRDALANNPELKNNPALDGLRKMLLKELLTFSKSLRDRLQADKDTRSGALNQLASECQSLGLLMREIGDMEGALTTYREALAIYQKLVDADPASSRLKSELAQSHDNVGNMLTLTGQPEEARRELERARIIRQGLADPGRPVNESTKRH